MNALKRREQRKQVLTSWINGHSRGDDGFTAMHFASFHGDMNLIRLLARHGADAHAVNR